MLPIAVTGLVLRSINPIVKIKNNKKKSFLLIIIILYLILDVDIFIRPKGFLYPGILLNIGAILLFCFFGTLLIDISLNEYLILIISNVTNFTGGIYYLHIFIKNILKIKFSLIKKRQISASVIIYIICYLICLIGNKIFGKTKLKYLFY